MNTTYDIVAIGIGSFNLGLAALTSNISTLKCLFIDDNKEFNWHPGMLLDSARLQVPFYADLVTLADPCNKFSYLNFLKHRQRLFRFAIQENNFIYRKEYNEYCKWVINQLSNCRFGFRCEAIHYQEQEGIYKVFVRDTLSQMVSVFLAKHIVIGTGTVPNYPACYSPDSLEQKHPFILHSSNYLNVKEHLLSKKSVSIIGSGQSAAEIFNDLLPYSSRFTAGLSWFTRSERFYPMEYSRLSLEMTSPDYIGYFYHLHADKKPAILQKQNMLYKGINFSLINEIYDSLYQQSLYQATDHIRLCTNTELKSITNCSDGRLQLQFHHSEQEKSFAYITDALILATGYRYSAPAFIEPVKHLIQWMGNKYQVSENYSIDRRNSIFVQNAELHTHGFNAPDLGMGPYRNAVILNTILGYEHFKMETNIAFQSFGMEAINPHC
jgi:lysine N6-hydroxylase